MLGWMLSKMRERDREDGRSSSGGGRPRIRLGRTGPRGRIYSTKSSASMRTSIAKSSYVGRGRGAARHISAHLKYIQEREKGELERDKDRDFFDRDKDGIDRAQVELEIKQNQGRKVSMHKLILSPGDNKIDLREYTKESMGALEERLGHKLLWYGVEHLNTDNHHVHVVIAGKIPERELTIERAEIQEREEETERRYRAHREKDSERTREEARLERLLDRIEKEAIAKEAARDRGDVYLDSNDLKELRAAGNEFRIRERSFDRALERAFEREFDREIDKDRDREPERVKAREIERPLQGPGYDREKAEQMIEQLLAKTESTDRYQDLLDRIVEDDRSQFDEYFKERQDKDLPQERDEALDRLLGWKPEKTREKEQEEYQQRTGFAGEAEPERADDAAQTFEADRQVLEQQQSQDTDRDRDDDLDRFDDFGR